MWPIVYCMYVDMTCLRLQIEPEALFQLLLALSQKCSDELHILDLVEGDKPLMPLVRLQSFFHHAVYNGID